MSIVNISLTTEKALFGWSTIWFKWCCHIRWVYVTPMTDSHNFVIVWLCLIAVGWQLSVASSGHLLDPSVLLYVYVYHCYNNCVVCTIEHSISCCLTCESSVSHLFVKTWHEIIIIITFVEWFSVAWIIVKIF